MSERLTVLQIAQRAMSSIGMVAPSSLTTSADDNASQILQCLYETADDMIRRYDWQVLKTEGTISTLAAESQGDIYTLFPDFRRYINDTGWNVTTQTKLVGPASSQLWRQAKASSSIGVVGGLFRFVNDLLYIYGQSIAGQNIQLEYVSSRWLKRGLDRSDTITANSDVCLLHGQTMVFGVQARWLSRNGQDSSAAFADYEASLKVKMGEDGGKEILLATPVHSRNRSQFAALSINGVSESGATHDHDDRYYTEGEINALLVGVGSGVYQPLDAELTALAGLAPAADVMPYFTGTASAALTGLTAFGRSLLDDASDAAARATLGLIIGTNVQAFDADLTAIAALGSTGLSARTAANTWAQRTIAGTDNEITVSDGDGVAGNPTLALHAGVYREGGTDVAIADGGTGQGTATAGFDALAPTTTRGDLIARGVASNSRVAVGASGKLLRSDGTDPGWSTGISEDGAGNVTAVASINNGPLAGFRNKLMNGCMSVNQRLSTSNIDDTYAFDRWIILTETAAVAIGSQTNIENTWHRAMRVMQAQAAAQRFGVSQIIESLNCQDLRGQTVTLSARVRMSASTTLRYAILEWTGTADAVTSDSVNDWASGTFTSGNFFIATTVTATGSTALTANTSATVSLSATLGSSVNNVVVVFWTDSTQAQNVTLDIGKVQLEPGATATTFERRPRTVEELLCMRYYSKSFAADVTPGHLAATTHWAAFNYATNKVRIQQVRYPVIMRAAPTMTYFASSGNFDSTAWAVNDSGTWQPAGTNTTATASPTSDSCQPEITLSTALGSTNRGVIAAGDYTADAEL